MYINTVEEMLSHKAHDSIRRGKNSYDLKEISKGPY